MSSLMSSFPLTAEDAIDGNYSRMARVPLWEPRAADLEECSSMLTWRGRKLWHACVSTCPTCLVFSAPFVVFSISSCLLQH